MEMIVVLFALLSCCFAAPQQPIAVAIDNCVLPKTQVCSVDYPVPPSVALMAPVLEAKITAAYNSELQQGNAETCAKSLREVRCARSFPRCSNDSTLVTVTSLDCGARLQCATSQTALRLRNEHFCSLSESTVPNTRFKSATDYGYTFSYCSVDSSWLVTDWMFLLLKFEDTYLSSASVLGDGGFLPQNYPMCSAGYANYECRIIGQCDSSGHVTVNFTRQQCEQATSCYPSTLLDSTPCSLWPVLTTAAPTVGSTTEAPVTATYAKQIATTFPTGGVIMLSFESSAPETSLSVLMIALLAAISLFVR